MSDNRALKLLEAFSGVEEDLLERCENAVVCAEFQLQGNVTKAVNRGKVVSLTDKLKNFGKNSWRYGSAIAAVLCVAIVGLAYLSNLRVGVNDSAAYEVMMDETSGGAVAPENGVAADGAMQATASTPTTYYGTAESVETEGTTEQTDGGADDSLRSTNSINNREEKSASTDDLKDATVSGQESAVVEEALGSCKEFVYVTVTEGEARAHEVFGAYVPTRLPEGYVLEGAYVSGEGEQESLMVSWSRGLDSIMVNITLPEETPVTVDVAKTETYDEYLYEIPHAETVPEEYREVFNNPVCAWEDFSLEFVQKRMIVREDAGDTDTPRGNFSVLYPDGVLVYFNGRGTAEEIRALFESMEASN